MVLAFLEDKLEMVMSNFRVICMQVPRNGDIMGIYLLGRKDIAETIANLGQGLIEYELN